MSGDLRIGLRRLRDEPVSTLAVLVTLAAAFGANAGLFPLLREAVLPTFPYPESERVVFVGTRLSRFDTFGGVSLPISDEVLRSAPSLETAGIFRSREMTVTWHSEPAVERVVQATSSLFDVMAVEPLIGRRLLPSDLAGAAPPVAVLSYESWQKHYGGAEEVLGRTLRIDGVVLDIVGVMPRGFFVPERSRAQSFGRSTAVLWTPLWTRPAQHAPSEWLNDCCGLLARLRPGQSVQDLRREIEAITRRAPEISPTMAQLMEDWGFELAADAIADYSREQLHGPLRSRLFLLQAAVGLLLLVCCVNVAILSLGRLVVRFREFALRSSLGATASQITRQLVAENLVLYFSGALLGVGLSAFVRALLVKKAGAEGLASEASLGLTLAFGLALAAVLGLLFGLVPAFYASRASSFSLFASARQANAPPPRLQGPLVAFQFGLAVMLLTGTLFLTRSLLGHLQIQTGFEREDLVTVSVRLSSTEYQERESVSRFVERVLTGLESSPEVSAQASTTLLPFRPGEGEYLLFTPERDLGSNLPARMARHALVSQGYFETLGLPLHRGRGLLASDVAEADAVVVVDRTLALQLSEGGLEVVGSRLHWGDLRLQPGDAPRRWWTVVGVVGDSRVGHFQTDEPPGADGTIYFPQAQILRADNLRRVSFVARARVPADRAEQRLRAAVAGADPGLALENVGTMDHHIRAALASPARGALLLGVSAVFTLLLASLGVFAVLSRSASARRQEIGVRLALGSGARGIVRLILGFAAPWVLVGGLLGLVGAATLGRTLRVVDPTVGLTSLWVYGLAFGLLLAVGAAAASLPAWRATRIDPAECLRSV